MPVLPPILAMLLALGVPHAPTDGVMRDDPVHHVRVAEVDDLSESTTSARVTRWEGIATVREVPVARQVRIEQRVILRISPQSGSARRSMLADLPRRAPSRMTLRPHGDCIDASSIVGVSDRGSRLMMYMRDRSIISAELEKACSPRDFYLGFYVERNEDGRLCVDRDRLMSRAGAKCQLASLQRLVPVRAER